MNRRKELRDACRTLENLSADTERVEKKMAAALAVLAKHADILRATLMAEMCVTEEQLAEARGRDLSTVSVEEIMEPGTVSAMALLVASGEVTMRLRVAFEWRIKP